MLYINSQCFKHCHRLEWKANREKLVWMICLDMTHREKRVHDGMFINPCWAGNFSRSNYCHDTTMEDASSRCLKTSITETTLQARTLTTTLTIGFVYSSVCKNFLNNWNRSFITSRRRTACSVTTKSALVFKVSHKHRRNVCHINPLVSLRSSFVGSVHRIEIYEIF